MRRLDPNASARVSGINEVTPSVEALSDPRAMRKRVAVRGLTVGIVTLPPRRPVAFRNGSALEVRTRGVRCERMRVGNGRSDSRPQMAQKSGGSGRWRADGRGGLWSEGKVKRGQCRSLRAFQGRE